MEVEQEASCSPSSAAGGSREYKVVMLGAGGVGKSGKFSHRTLGKEDPGAGDAAESKQPNNRRW